MADLHFLLTSLMLILGVNLCCLGVAGFHPLGVPLTKHRRFKGRIGEVASIWLMLAGLGTLALAISMATVLILQRQISTVAFAFVAVAVLIRFLPPRAAGWALVALGVLTVHAACYGTTFAGWFQPLLIGAIGVKSAGLAWSKSVETAAPDLATARGLPWNSPCRALVLHAAIGAAWLVASLRVVPLLREECEEAGLAISSAATVGFSISHWCVSQWIAVLSLHAYFLVGDWWILNARDPKIRRRWHWGVLMVFGILLVITLGGPLWDWSICRGADSNEGDRRSEERRIVYVCT